MRCALVLLVFRTNLVFFFFLCRIPQAFTGFSTASQMLIFFYFFFHVHFISFLLLSFSLSEQSHLSGISAQKDIFFSFKDRVSRSNPHQHILLFSFFPFSEQSSTSSRPYECNAFCANTVLNIILFDTCSVTMGVPWQVKSSTSSLGRYISLRIDWGFLYTHVFHFFSFKSQLKMRKPSLRLLLFQSFQVAFTRQYLCQLVGQSWLHYCQTKRDLCGHSRLWPRLRNTHEILLKKWIDIRIM